MKILLTSLLLFSSSLFATVYSPWTRNLFEIESRITPGFLHRQKIETSSETFISKADDPLLAFSLATSPYPDFDFEAELMLARSDSVSFGYEAFWLTLRKQWSNDLQGDPYAFTTGVSLSFPGAHFINDLSYSYHGRANAEFHAALGREIVNCETLLWDYRWWTLGGIGIGNRGSPWLHWIGTVEADLNCLYQTGLFMEALLGLGSNNIIPFEPFDGYASVKHRSIVLGGFLTRQLGVLGSLTLQGDVTVYAHNFPLYMYTLQLELLIPFSL